MVFYVNDLTGGFYSDTKAYIGVSCLKCPNGTFVNYKNAPGTRAIDCIACPQGSGILIHYYKIKF